MRLFKSLGCFQYFNSAPDLSRRDSSVSFPFTLITLYQPSAFALYPSINPVVFIYTWLVSAFVIFFAFDPVTVGAQALIFICAFRDIPEQPGPTSKFATSTCSNMVNLERTDIIVAASNALAAEVSPNDLSALETVT